MDAHQAAAAQRHRGLLLSHEAPDFVEQDGEQSTGILTSAEMLAPCVQRLQQFEKRKKQEKEFDEIVLIPIIAVLPSFVRLPIGLQVEFIPALYGKQIEQLVLRNCPLCASASPELLRGFFTASMPRLTSFNEVEIGAQERQQAEALYGPMIRVLRLTSAETVQQQNQRLGISSSGSANANTGVATNKLVSKSAAAAAPSLLKAHQKQSTRNAGQGGILLSLSAGLGLQRDAAQSQSRTAGPPLVPPAASSSFSSSSSPSCTPCSSVGSRTADLLRAAASGQVPASATTVSNSTSTAATADAQGAPLALSQRSLYRRSAQAQFAAAFDEAFKRIVFETVAEIKQS